MGACPEPKQRLRWYSSGASRGRRGALRLFSAGIRAQSTSTGLRPAESFAATAPTSCVPCCSAQRGRRPRGPSNGNSSSIPGLIWSLPLSGLCNLFCAPKVLKSFARSFAQNARTGTRLITAKEAANNGLLPEIARLLLGHQLNTQLRHTAKRIHQLSNPVKIDTVGHVPVAVRTDEPNEVGCVPLFVLASGQ